MRMLMITFRAIRAKQAEKQIDKEDGAMKKTLILFVAMAENRRPR